ncbi:MAG TPA: anthranilate synthase component I family protein [Haliangiales bacterium]|nr:anthranilate synthase component I family protein [Haliangiales bacterium]
MRPLIHEIVSPHSPESLVDQLPGEPGVVLLRSALLDSAQARYSFVAARPFLTFRSFGSRCELHSREHNPVQFGNPWHLLDGLMARYELLDEVDLPFPLGGCFGYWGFDLKNFVEPRLSRRAVNDLELPDCHVGFYDSLVVMDHRLGKTWVVSTGLDLDGSRSERRAERQRSFWRDKLHESPRSETARSALELSAPPTHSPVGHPLPLRGGEGRGEGAARWFTGAMRAQSSEESLPQSDGKPEAGPQRILSNVSRADFIAAVERARRYIRSGDIYQVNLSQRLAAPCFMSGWEFFQRLTGVSPAPFAAFLDCGGFQIASSSPELFLRLSGPHIQTRPIKGTRPRAADPTRDAQLTYELQTSPKEMAELVMITDLLRNDLGKVSEYGSVQVPELVRLERYAQVQHLVSSVEGRLRSDVTHFAAFASCFPGGSISGAPKIRALEIIDELEPITRGPYTGALGYLGFNRESQLSILIRAAICREGMAYFHVGAGIVADSVPAAEYEETLAKAGGFMATLNLHPQSAYAFLKT